uniref:PilZ domain-containing protein n=1 Tax=Globodera rostochiensis TaxID=31243 RepID=A0A914HLL2_GLORO
MTSSNNVAGIPSAPVSSALSSDAVQRLLRSDPYMAELVKGLPVCFAGIPHAKETERQQNFLHSIQTAKRLHIAIPSNGLNLYLNLTSEHLVPERNEVQFVSDLHFNGARVRLRGHVNARTLQGKVQIEMVQVQEHRQFSERLERRMVQLRAAALRL